jgi:hypothetical protein
MSILSELKNIVSAFMPVETGVFSDLPPETYAVLTPLADTFPLNGDDMPISEVCNVRISIFSKENYLMFVRKVLKQLILSGFTVTGRQYIGREDDTGYYNTAIDVAKEYIWEEADPT